MSCWWRLGFCGPEGGKSSTECLLRTEYTCFFSTTYLIKRVQPSTKVQIAFSLVERGINPPSNLYSLEG